MAKFRSQEKTGDAVSYLKKISKQKNNVALFDKGLERKLRRERRKQCAENTEYAE